MGPHQMVFIYRRFVISIWTFALPSHLEVFAGLPVVAVYFMLWIAFESEWAKHMCGKVYTIRCCIVYISMRYAYRTNNSHKMPNHRRKASTHSHRCPYKMINKARLFPSSKLPYLGADFSTWWSLQLTIRLINIVEYFCLVQMCKNISVILVVAKLSAPT